MRSDRSLLESGLHIVVKTVNYIKCGGKSKSASFGGQMDSENAPVLLHAKVTLVLTLFKLRWKC